MKAELVFGVFVVLFDLMRFKVANPDSCLEDAVFCVLDVQRVIGDVQVGCG